MEKVTTSMIYIGNKSHGATGIYVGRPSVLGNPYMLDFEDNRPRIIQQYKEWLLIQLQNKNSMQYKMIQQLIKKAQKEDIVLVCWCSPKQCHAEVIKDIIENELQRV